MKKIIIGLIALGFTGLVSAEVGFPAYADNPDMYSGINDSSTLASTVQPGIGDSYGGSALDNGTRLQGLVRGSSSPADDYNGAAFLDTDNLSSDI